MLKGLFTTSTNFTNKSANPKKLSDKKRAQKYRDLIRNEAMLGGQVFGPVPNGVRREFFCLDEHTWVWHEEWTDQLGQKHVQTTRYDVRADGVVKCQNNQPYVRISPSELNNLVNAANKYVELVSTKIYGQYLTNN
jgi:hypothetical protein